MTTQPVEANVVLTADNAQYDTAMSQSSQSTDNLGKSVDSLASKISSLTKTAGKTLIGITAADVAMIGTATAAWSQYEKQVSRLQSQAAVLTRTNHQQERVMKDYTMAVKGLRTEYGTTTTEAAKLVETLSKVTDVKKTRQLTDLSKVFVEMSHATGESSEGLANSLTNLQKIMGTPVNVKTSKDYADMFVTLAASTNTSATALADFTAQLAPVGEMMGMNQKQVAGFATAFTRAGQDGLAASTVFNKVAGDITKSIQSGSGEVEHYANLIGVSSEKFKKMEGAEQMLRIFEALEARGAGAATELNRLGLEGPRSMKAISGVISQAGGVRQALGLAEGAYGSGASAEAAKASTRGMSDEFAKLREEMKMTAETFGELFGPAIEKFMQSVVKASGYLREMAEGPLGKLVGALAGLVALFTGSVGPMLLFAGVLLKIAAGFTAIRSSAAYGVREGVAGNAGMVRMPDGSYRARGTGTLGERGAEIARDPNSTWFQRGTYGGGQAIGAGIRGIGDLGREGWQAGRSRLDPNYTPGPSRSALSYLAGGTGAVLRQTVTPAFDQMRYQSVADRSSWLGHEAPWAGRGEASRLSRAMGAVGEATTAKASLMEETRKTYRDPFLTDQERQARLENLKTLHQETNARLRTATETERTTQASILAQRTQTEEVKKSREGFKGFTQAIAGVGGGMVGGVAGAGKAGLQAAWRSGMAPNLVGGIGTAVMATEGVESNAMMLGGMGMMMGGGYGAAAGAAVGIGLDMASANDKAADSVKNLKDQADEISKSGAGLAGMDKAAKDTTESVDDLAKSFENQQQGWRSTPIFPGVTVGMVTDPKAAFGGAKNTIEGIFGESDIEELEGNQDKAQKKLKETEGTVRDLAKAMGAEVSGTRKTQLGQLEEFITGEGAQRLADAGVDLEDLVKASEKGGSAYTDMLNKVARSGETSGLWDRLEEAGGTGKTMVTSQAGQMAIQYQDNVAYFYEATNEVFDTAVRQGKSYLSIMKEAETAQSIIGDENSREYELQVAISQKAQQAMAMQAPQLGRAGAFRQTLQIGQALQGVDTTKLGAEQAGQIEASRQASLQAVGDQISYFRQLLLAQDQYELGRERAQEDYHEQRMYQEHDYNLSRSRANESFERSRRRAVMDFHRGQERAQYQFNLSRSRAEDDYNHQVQIQAKQMATSVYDIYTRVQTERTDSAEWILHNAEDQLKRMQEQSANLDTLRARGLSDTAIQQLGLTDPQNAQQLARFMTEVTPAMIAQFNKTAGAERVKAAKDLVTDPSSLEFQEMERGFRKSMTRGAEDFELQMKQSKQDFKRGLRQNREDFNIMMGQQAEDYDTSMMRQEKSYKKSMDRAAEDMANMANEILLTNEQVLVQSQERLTGAARKQARQVANSLQKLSTDTKPEAVKFMTELAAIYGFEYTVPKEVSAMAIPSMIGAAQSAHQQAEQAGLHEGGMVPGWSPGRDDRMVPLSGGEAVMRPEWARAMGKETIDAMNHAAKHGGFAGGGVYWPVPGHETGTYPGHDGVDINRGSGSDDLGDPIRAFRAGTITYVGSGHGYGDAIFQKTKAGTVVYGHTSAQNVVAGQLVTAGQLIGAVGSTGNSSAPHLHFGIPGGTYAQAMALLDGALIGGDFGGGILGAVTGAVAQVQALELLKKKYPKAEQSAAGMKGVHSFTPGMISAVMNKYARQRLNQEARSGAGPVGDFGTNIGNQPNENLSNEGIVHTGANRMGWGDQWPALRQLVMHESGFNNTAQNPTSTAYGMFQFLDSTWAGVNGRKTSDPWKQTQYGLRYIKNRYDDPNGAWDWWQAHNWYGEGAVFDSPQTIGVGENGPEAVIPLNTKGGEFMADVMARSVGMGSVPAGGGMGAVYNTKIDRSTNFSGPITVQANNPEELITKLQARQRVMALSRPALTGSAA